MKTSFDLNINNPQQIREIRKRYYPHLVQGFGMDQLLVEASIFEAILNAWKHGHHEDAEKEIRVHISFMETRMVVRINDQGDGFDWRRYLFTNDMKHWFPRLDHIEEPGRGMVLLLRVMDVLRYNEKGNECLLMKKYQNQE